LNAAIPQRRAAAVAEAGGGTRTHGLALTRRLLYQLSYSGAEHRVAGGAGQL
jgi:hypothetical protein